MIAQPSQVLELNRFLHILADYASCPLGHSDCLSRKPTKDLKTIESAQRLVSEMKFLLDAGGVFPFE